MIERLTFRYSLKPNLWIRFLDLAKRIVIANIESAGIIVEKLTFLRAIIIASAIFSTLAIWLYRDFLTLPLVCWYAVFHFVFRQGFLLLSFTPTGIAYQLKKHWGEKRGYDLYEFFTGMSFFHRSSSFVLLVQFTMWDGLQFLKEYAGILSLVSYVFTIIGLVINTWSFLLIKRETYYYLDMYYGRFLVPFKRVGPYKWFKNPMYSIGQLPAYGIAVAVGSLPGLILTIGNQICSYLFYYLFELPHINKILQKGKQASSVKENSFATPKFDVLSLQQSI